VLAAALENLLLSFGGKNRHECAQSREVMSQNHA
jgi:hypothetical protein